MNKKAICVKNQEMKRNPRNNFIQKRNESNKNEYEMKIKMIIYFLFMQSHFGEFLAFYKKRSLNKDAIQNIT